MCLAATSGNTDNADFAGLVYRNCSNGDSNQDFFMKKNGRLSGGEIHAIKDFENYCLQMADPNPSEKYYPSVYMHSDCSDEWDVLDSGALKNVRHRKCLGRQVGSLRVVGVECDSSIAEHFSAIDNQYALYNLHFKTASTAAHSESSDPLSFEIDSYGYIPQGCHNTTDSECDIQLKGSKFLTIRALKSDAWAFTITGDIGELLSYETVTDNQHFDPFPAVMDNDEYDIKQKYALEIKHATRECYFVHFKTLFASSNTTGSFFIDGYGSMPHECYSKHSAECDIKICGRRTLVMRAFTQNKWQFEISGDIEDLYNHKTVPGGTHNKTVATMDIDEYDYLQVYKLVPYSSCAHRALSDNQCKTNPTYMQEHCAALCNLLPLVSLP